MIILYKVVRIVIIVYLLFGLMLYIFQRDLLYFPAEEVAHDYPVEQVLSGDETINLIILNPGQPKAIIYLGGNAETPAHSASSFENVLPGYTMYFVNYRGYGGSTGKPSEQGMYADVTYIYDVLAARHEAISVMGRSLGSAIATYLAANREIDKLVLITPFDSVESLARERYSIYPVSLLLKDKYPSIDWVKKIDVPTLILLAELDIVVPAEHSQRLIARFLEQLVTVKTFQGLSHNNISFLPDYFLELKKFLLTE